MKKQPAVYIITNKYNGTLYTGFTTNLKQRIWQHKKKIFKGFSQKYGLDILIWYELHDTLNGAIVREKQIKEWNRDWKIELVECKNPKWCDLYNSLF